MAVNYSDLEPGTAVTWTSSGGTKAITLTSLANGAMREGAKSATLIDGAKGLPELCVFTLEAKVGSAATAGREISLFVGSSPSGTVGTGNPAGLTGADAAVSNPTEKTPQLTLVGSLVLSNALGTGLQRSQELRYRPLQPFVVPVVYNDSGQAMGSTGTDHVITMTPFYRRAPIA